MDVLSAKNPARLLIGLQRHVDEDEDLEGEFDAENADAIRFFRAEAMGGTDDDDDDEEEEDEDDDLDGQTLLEQDGDQIGAPTDTDHEVEEDPGSVLLRAGTSIQIDLFAQLSGPSSLALTEDSQFRVILDDENQRWVDILVPYYGHCRVERDLVDRFVPNPDANNPLTSVEQGYNGTITSLDLDLSLGFNGKSLLPLLKYLGPKLTSLMLQTTIEMRSTCFRALLDACPHLKVLEICDAHRNVERDLLAAYEERRCMVSDICIRKMHPGCSTKDLIRALQDPKSAAAQTIQELKLCPESSKLFDAPLLTAILEMLRVNLVLEHLQLDIAPSLYEVFKPQFLRFHGQSLPVVKHPLSLEHRVAFLGVVDALRCKWADRRGDGDAARKSRKRVRLTHGIDVERLDRGVLSLIFLFASERPTRRIVLRRS